MRQLHTFGRYGVFFVCVGLLSACTGAPTYNPTVFPAKIDQPSLDAHPMKTVVIAHVNRGSQSRNYLKKEAPRIDAQVTEYLRDNGFTVLPQRKFEQHWNTAVRAFGNPVDPTSGKINAKTFALIMQRVRDKLVESSNIDGFIFTDLVEVQESFSGGMKHLARWDGVTRAPTMQGPGDGVSASFDWSMMAAMVSLRVIIYDAELKLVFYGGGGIDATDAIDSRSTKGRYIRRRNILENESNIMEGIQLAFYPLIAMEDWPGNP